MQTNVFPDSWATYSATQTEDFNKRIFFHETSGKTRLSMIQCCAVESAARHHPLRSIHLFVRPSKKCFGTVPALTSTPSTYNPVWLEVLSHYPNVSTILVDEENYFRGTPLEDWYFKKEWRKSLYETAHLSDYIRILTLYKGGGLYLDLDILTLKPYHGGMFRNFLVYGSSRKDHISNGAMHLEHGHWLSEKIIKMLAKEYDPKSYIYHGPDVVTEVMKNVCGLVAGSRESNKCSDVQLLSDYLFYPIPSITSNTLFQDESHITDATLIKINTSFGLHLWNSLSRLQKPLDMNSNQVTAIVAREHCPITFSRMADFKLLEMTTRL